MECNMLALTKQASIAIAVTRGAALSMPLSIPAFFASSNIAMLNRAAPPSRNGNLVGLLAKRKHISDDYVDLLWRGPVVDFSLYYGPPIQFRHSKKGTTTRGSGKN
jgi:hypothetical protein